MGYSQMQAPPPPCQRVQDPGRELVASCCHSLLLVSVLLLSVQLCLFAGGSASMVATGVYRRVWRKDLPRELEHQTMVVASVG